MSRNTPFVNNSIPNPATLYGRIRNSGKIEWFDKDNKDKSETPNTDKLLFLDCTYSLYFYDQVSGLSLSSTEYHLKSETVRVFKKGSSTPVFKGTAEDAKKCDSMPTGKVMSVSAIIYAANPVSGEIIKLEMPASARTSWFNFRDSLQKDVQPDFFVSGFRESTKEETKKGLGDNLPIFEHWTPNDEQNQDAVKACAIIDGYFETLTGKKSTSDEARTNTATDTATDTADVPAERMDTQPMDITTPVATAQTAVDGLPF